MERYQHHVLGIVKRNIPFELVGKIVQDVFVRVYKALKNFKLGDPLKPWLTTIALRTCYDYWRKQYRCKEIVMSSMSIDHCKWLDCVLAEQSTESWRRDCRIEEARQVLDWALSKLSAEDRMALTLTYLEGYSNREAARLLGWSTANIKIRMLRARRKLHKLLIGGHRETRAPSSLEVVPVGSWNWATKGCFVEMGPLHLRIFYGSRHFRTNVMIAQEWPCLIPGI